MIQNEDLLANALKTMDDGVDRILFLLNMESQWDSHPDHPREDWYNEACENSTSLGYWHWVVNQILGDNDDNDD